MDDDQMTFLDLRVRTGHRYCILCGGEYGADIAADGDHNCVNKHEYEQFCGHCGAELNDNGSCDNDHGPEVPDGLQKRKGVEVGCGSSNCQMCYEALRALRDNVERDLSGYWTESTSNVMQQADEALTRMEE